ncbi:MAG TPA: BON domain-containing protein, partial [Gemmataceae bacterium]|nr:BON domain-containing protein [Gemmataceae bacterium]
MKVRALYPLAAAAGLWMPSIGSAQQPAMLPVAANPNQVLADAVASQLRTSGVAANSDVSIVAQEGVVTLTGFAKDAAQKARIAAAVKGVNGVLAVRDGVNTPAGGVVQVQNPALPLAPVGPAPVAGPVGGDGPLVEPCPLGASGQVGPEMGAPNLPPYSWPTYAPYNNVSRVAYPQAHPYNAFPFIG